MGEKSEGGAYNMKDVQPSTSAEAVPLDMYSRSPKNPALQLLQKSSKSASAGS